MRAVQQTGVLLLTLVIAGRGGDPGIRREAGYWVSNETGSEPMPANGILRITASGDVKVTGALDERVTYVVTRRVKAPTESEARRLLHVSRVSIWPRERITLLVIEAFRGEIADVAVRAPRSARDIIISTHGGSVEASNLDGSLHAETGGGRVLLDRIGGQVTALTAGGDIVLGAMGGSVRCISGGGPISARAIRGEAHFETAGGNITVEQVDGPVRCSTGAGGIRIERAGSTVNVDTLGGPIEVLNARGLITARNSGGPIEVGVAGGGARCESAGGAIRLTNVSGALHASTAVGNIVARLQAGSPIADCFLTTGSGDVTLWIPSKLPVTVRARNESMGGNKRIISDFTGIISRPAGAEMIAEGSLNGGGPLVRLVSTGGTIYIRRDK